MPLTAAQRELVRGEIGSDTTVFPDDPTLDSLFDGMIDPDTGQGLVADPVTGQIDLTPLIVLVLKERKAALLGGATSFSVAGVYSENSTETVKALERQIDRAQMGNRTIKTRMMIRRNRARSFAGPEGSTGTPPGLLQRGRLL